MVENKLIKNSPSMNFILEGIVAIRGAKMAMTRPRNNIEVSADPGGEGSEAIIAVFLYILIENV